MLDPTSVKFLKVQRLLRNGQMVGRERPVGRVTWAKGRLHGVTSAKAGVGVLRYLDKTAPETEFDGIRTIETDRSIGNDAATCTITMWNTRPEWAAPEGIDTEGAMGYLSPTRGQKSAVPSPSVFDVYDGNVSIFTEDDPDPELVGPTIKYPTDWNYTANEYRDVLIPNTVLRTYQGYGSANFDEWGNHRAPTDPDYVHPDDDDELFQTGVWLIDKVTFQSDGTVSIECRDLAKLLLEQFVYPPMIPMSRFPLIYNPAHEASGHKESIGKNVAKFSASSVDAKHGKNGSINGHRGSHAFDTSSGTFWESGRGEAKTGVEWLQATSSGSINEVVLQCVHGNFVVYIAVHENGSWQGTSTISGSSENLSDLEGGSFFYVIAPGDTLWDLAGTYYGDNTLWPIIASANNNIIKDPHWIYPGQRVKIPYVKGTKSPPPAHVTGATAGTHTTIPYVVKATVPASGKVTIKLPRTYKASHVRAVFTNLYRYGTDDYRADCRTMVVRNHIGNTFKPSTIGKASYITDWVEPIKEMLAWAGFTFFDPEDPTSLDPDILTGKTKSGSLWLKHYPSTTSGRSIPTRVWGDFEYLGAGPVVSTPGDYFMSKSFKEAIQLIVDFIGAIFFIDESGGAQFRLPNFWNGGNFVADPSAGTSVKGYIENTYPIEFHEDANLVNYSAVINDEALRSEVLVVGAYPNTKATAPIAGGTVLGYNSATGTTSAIDFTNVLAGQYRLMMVPGESTKLFKTQAECQRMAELTALFIMFTYRQGSLNAPAHPALQIDDQVRIYERVTGENFIHYVSSIKTTQDLEQGQYTQDITTHWLGSDPNTDWFPKKITLTPAVKSLPAILARLGQQAPDDASLPLGAP